MHISGYTIILCAFFATTVNTANADGFDFAITLEGEYAPELPLSGTYSSPGFAGPQAFSQIQAGGNDLTSGRVFCRGHLDYAQSLS